MSFYGAGVAFTLAIVIHWFLAGSFAFKLTVFLAVIAKTRTKLPWFGRCCCAWFIQLLGMVLWQFLIAMDTSLLLIDVLTSYTSKGWMLLSHTMKVILSMQLRTFLWCTHVLEVARRRCYENLDNLIWQNLCLVLQVTQDAIKVILTWRPPRMLPRDIQKNYKNRSRPRRRRDGQHVTSVTKKIVFSRVSLTAVHRR